MKIESKLGVVVTTAHSTKAEAERHEEFKGSLGYRVGWGGLRESFNGSCADPSLSLISTSKARSCAGEVL